MSRTKIAVTILICLALLSLYAPGQFETQSTPAPASGSGAVDQPQYVVNTLPPPLTKLEAFAAKKNIVLVRGYSKAAEVTADDGAIIRISAVDFSSADMNHPERHTGLAIQVNEGNRTNRTAISYVDAEEIDSVLDSIARLTQLHATSTKLDDYDAGFRTTGDLEITNFNRDGSRVAGVRSVQVLNPSGQICIATAYFRLARLQEVSQQIAAAKAQLDRMNNDASAGK